MTNKYQEALIFLDENPITYLDENADRHYDEDIEETIREALQAGAEGRILPKLPEGWEIFCFAYVPHEGKYFCETKHTKSGMLCRCKNIDLGWGKTPAEAMQNAIDKIGGAV